MMFVARIVSVPALVWYSKKRLFVPTVVSMVLTTVTISFGKMNGCDVDRNTLRLQITVPNMESVPAVPVVRQVA